MLDNIILYSILQCQILLYELYSPEINQMLVQFSSQKYRGQNELDSYFIMISSCKNDDEKM